MYSALPLGIITREKPLSGPALNHHLQLFFPSSKLTFKGIDAHVRFLPGLGPFQFEKLGYYSIEAETYDQVVLKKPANLIEQFASMLADGAYIRAIINEFFIAGSVPHMRSHRRHDILLIGYSRLRKTFIYVGYQHDGAFASREVPARVLIESLHLDKYGISTGVAPVAIQAIRPNIASHSNINQNLIKSQLVDYLSGVHNVSKYQISGPFSIPQIGGVRWGDPAGRCGISVYESFQEYFKFLSSNPKRIDLRATRVLFEHKSMVKLALMDTVGDSRSLLAIKRFDTVVALAHRLHMTAFAISKSVNNSRISSLISLTKDIRDREIFILNDILGSW